MANLILNGSTSGSVTLSSPAVSGTTTLTLPTTSGTVITTGSTFAGTGPAFSAYLSSASQTMTAATWTKVILNSENFDTNSNFDSTTNYRFTPTVSGYYQFNCQINAASGSNTSVQGSIYKNGAAYTKFSVYATSAILDDWMIQQGALIYLNGSTDYIEMFVLIGSTQNIIGNANITKGTQTLRYQREMPIELRLYRRHIEFLSFMAAISSPLDAGMAEWSKIRTLVDDLPYGKQAQIGMTFTSRGWQATGNLSQALDTTLPWQSRFATTVLQLTNIASVAYGRGLGHTPAMKGYIMGSLMWWRGPQGPIYFEEFQGSSIT
jgi:hypothetical protein